MKPSDYYTVPLCFEHHREQHDKGEGNFWYAEERGNPHDIALGLARRSPDIKVREAVT